MPKLLPVSVKIFSDSICFLFQIPSASLIQIDSFIHKKNCLGRSGHLLVIRYLFLGGLSEFRDEDAAVIYDVEEERLLLRKGSWRHLKHLQLHLFAGYPIPIPL